LFDLAIIGGGPGGAATAIRAAELGLPTVLVEAAPAPSFRIGETVPPDIEPVLRRLGVWERFLRDGHLPCAGACSAWAGPELAWQDGFTSRYGGGWHLDRAKFDGMLIEAAESAGATILRGERTAAVQRTPGGRWRLSLASRGPSLRARFLVDASGRPAVFARRLGALRVRADRLVAAFAALPIDAGLPEVAHTVVESFEQGWWYAARVPGGNAVVSLFTDADIARRVSTSALAWHDLLVRTRHIYPMLGRPAPPRRVSLASAASQCLNPLHGPGWVAVGDAATAWDPLASAGIFHALQAGREAAEAVAGALGGDSHGLEIYSRAVQQRFMRFLFERRWYYALETRWSTSEFWRRRAGRPSQEERTYATKDAAGRATACSSQDVSGNK